MANELTVNVLYEVLREEIKKGNGKNVILISTDDCDTEMKHDFSPRYCGVYSLEKALKINPNNKSINHYIKQFGDNLTIIN